MKHKSTPILEVHVETNPEGTVMLTSEIGSVKMIPFKGTVTGPIFNGIVEPCGVDTQITNQNEVRHMSARYMLTGTDRDGRDCHIYVKTTAGSRMAQGRLLSGRCPPLSPTPLRWLLCSTAISSWVRGYGTKADCGFVFMNYRRPTNHLRSVTAPGFLL